MIGVALGNKPDKVLPNKAIQLSQVISLATLVGKKGNLHSLGGYFVPDAVLEAFCTCFNPEHSPVRWVLWVTIVPL